MGEKFQSRIVISDGVTPRGKVKAIGWENLSEVSFHTGTVCNLSCPSCLEGSNPTNDAYEFLTLDDVIPFLEESEQAPNLQKYWFTGGEPFANPHFIPILDAAMQRKPVMVLTNATSPLENKLGQINELVEKYGKDKLLLRVSLDSYVKKEHDSERSIGQSESMYDKTLSVLRVLKKIGVRIAIAGRILEDDKDTAGHREAKIAPYRETLHEKGIDNLEEVLVFPRLQFPNDSRDQFEVSANCMKSKTDEEIASWMCSYMRFIVKPKGKKAYVLPCPVVHNIDLIQGSSLDTAVKQETYMADPNCYRMCYAAGTSCSGNNK